MSGSDGGSRTCEWEGWGQQDMCVGVMGAAGHVSGRDGGSRTCGRGQQDM